jgi:endo-1,4-beta-xylanase
MSLSLLGLAFVAGGAQDSAVPNALRSRAQERGFLVGAAVGVQPLNNEAIYSQTLAREYNLVVAEDAMKFGPLRPSRTQFYFADADAIVDFASAHRMKVRGHTLLWHNHNPKWLTDGDFSQAEISTIVKEHIRTVLGRFRGRVYAWDVVNEAMGDDAKLRETLWSKALGEDYIRQAFVWAREADSQAKLFYNDYGGEALGPKSDAIYRLLKDLKARGTPIDGIGLQSHFLVEQPPDMQNVAQNMKRLAALGLEIHVTEFDVRMSVPPTEQKLQKRAYIYRESLRTCRSILNCKAFLMWGFTDKHSWIPGDLPGMGAALPLDESYKQKPAYAALLDELTQIANSSTKRSKL